MLVLCLLNYLVQQKLSDKRCHTAQLVPVRFDGWVMPEWLGRWLQQWAARGVSEILGSHRHSADYKNQVYSIFFIFI